MSNYLHKTTSPLLVSTIGATSNVIFNPSPSINFSFFHSPVTISFTRFSFPITVAGAAATKLAIGLYDAKTRALITSVNNFPADVADVFTATVPLVTIRAGQTILLAITHNDAVNTLRFRGVVLTSITSVMTTLADNKFYGEIVAGGGTSLPATLPLADVIGTYFALPTIVLRS